MATAAVLWSFATAATGVVDRLNFLPASLQLHIPLVNVTLVLSGVALALCAVRACVGVGESAYSTITPSLIADYFPHHKRATALGVFQSAIPMGFALGFVIGGVLAHCFGWRVAFMLVGVPGLLTAVLVWRLREPRRGATEVPIQHESSLEAVVESPVESSRATSDSVKRDAFEEGSGDTVKEESADTVKEESALQTVARILGTRDWLISTAGYTALTAALGAFATWATVVLVRDKGMNETSAAVTLGVVTLLAGATGTFGGGWLADRVAARRHNRCFLGCAVSTLVGTVPTLLGLIADDPRVLLPSS